MRLARLREDLPLRPRLFLKFVNVVSGRRPPDILRVINYRPELFGKPFMAWVQAVMRGSSEWSIGERELFATWVSARNECPFCRHSHAAVASLALRDGGRTVKALFEDLRTAPVSEQVRATLVFLEKLTVHPNDVTAEDLVPLRAAGVSDAALEDAIHVCAIFNTINRIANALNFVIPPPEDLEAGAVRLHKGYQ